MTVEAALREEAEQHIHDHVEGERARVERVSCIRELWCSGLRTGCWCRSES